MARDGRQRIVDILCRRDGISVDEANRLIDDALEEIDADGYTMCGTEAIMMGTLGLEMDYAFDIIPVF